MANVKPAQAEKFLNAIIIYFLDRHRDAVGQQRTEPLEEKLSVILQRPTREPFRGARRCYEVAYGSEGLGQLYIKYEPENRYDQSSPLCQVATLFPSDTLAASPQDRHQEISGSPWNVRFVPVNDEV